MRTYKAQETPLTPDEMTLVKSITRLKQKLRTLGDGLEKDLAQKKLNRAANQLFTLYYREHSDYSGLEQVTSTNPFDQ